MKQVRTTSIIRQRGQLTIPEVIRRYAQWLVTNGVVMITFMSPNEIRIVPYNGNGSDGKNGRDWKTVKKQMERIRSFPGRNISLSKFLIRDRQTRR